MIKLIQGWVLMLIPMFALGFSGEKNQQIDAYDLLIRTGVISQVIANVENLRNEHRKSLPAIAETDFADKFDKIYLLYQLQSLGSYGLALQESFDSSYLKQLNNSGDIDMIKQTLDKHAEYQKKLTKYLEQAQAIFDENLKNTSGMINDM